MDSSMEHPQQSVRRGTIFSAETKSDQSHLKTEVVLLQRKYERLAQKERRMQVRTFKRSIVLLGKEKLENTKEQSKKDNPEKLATQGTQDEEKQNKNNPEKLATQGTQGEEKQNKNNPEKLATYGTQDEEKQNKNTTQYVVDTIIRK